MQTKDTAEAAEPAGSSPTSVSTRSRQQAVPSWRRLLLRALWLLLYPAAALTVAYMKDRPEFVERFFSQGIYPPLSTAVGAVFSIFPFSFSEMLVYAIVLFVLWFTVHCIRGALHRDLPLRQFVGWVLTILLVGGAGLNAFYWMWGFNYFRVPLRARMGITAVDKTPERLAALCILLAAQANALRQEVPEDSDGIFTYEGGKTAVLKQVPDAYRALGEKIPLFDRGVYNPKPVLASELLSYAGISGIFIPFTEEANVNVDDPALLIASSGAHETAHFLGVASEDEANFVAFLACMSSADRSVQYSGTMLALVHAGNALSRVSPEAYSSLWSSYSEAVVRDLDQYNAYLKSHQGKTAEQVDKMNDNYLKANGQTAGVASYGQMIDLLLDFYIQGAALP